MTDEFGTLARVAERAADRQKYARYAYVAPVSAEKTHRVTVNLKTGERTVEIVKPIAVTPAPAPVAPAALRVERPMHIYCEIRARRATNNHAPATPDHRGRVSDVVVTAAAVFGVTVNDLVSPHRGKKFAFPRFAAIHILHNVLRISLPSIGKVFNRDHTTCLAAVRRAAILRRSDIAFAGHSRLLARELRRKWAVQ